MYTSTQFNLDTCQCAYGGENKYLEPEGLPPAKHIFHTNLKHSPLDTKGQTCTKYLGEIKIRTCFILQTFIDMVV